MINSIRWAMFYALIRTALHIAPESRARLIYIAALRRADLDIAKVEHDERDIDDLDGW